MLTITVTTTSFGKEDKEPLKLLKEKGLNIIINPYGRKLEKEEVIALCKDTVGIIAGTEKLDADTLKNMPKLKVISRCGAGMENIDTDAAKKLNIKVYNTADVPTQAVAELTVGLILNLARKINQMDRALKNGKWEKLVGNLLCGKNVGIIGFGRIGRRVVQILKTFSCKVAYSDPFVGNGLLGLTKLSLEELLKWADIITIHASGDKEIIGRTQIQLMKKGAWLINVSRGGVVDEAAVYDVLNSKYLSGAALDVFGCEPYSGSLTKLDNCILTPHIGSYAVESRVNMEIQAVKNLLEGLGLTGG